MPEKNLVGIILATYQVKESFLEAQINSIKHQSWSRWVCHIVDDASSESTRTLISKLTHGDPRFVLHFHRQNLNSYYNFERGLRYLQDDPSITEIAFADQDDVWHKHKLAMLLDCLESEQADLVHSDLELIDANGTSLHPSVWQYENRYPEKLDPKLLLLRNTVTGCTVMFRRQLLPYILPFPQQAEPGDWYHDHWAALVAAQHGKIAHLRQPLVKYRQHGANTVGTQEQTGTIRKEIGLWMSKKYRLTRKSYRIHRDLSRAFYQRFYPGVDQQKINPFSDQRLDFGLSILSLGLRSLLSGYGSQGITLRLVVNKFIFDCLKIKAFLLRESVPPNA